MLISIIMNARGALYIFTITSLATLSPRFRLLMVKLRSLSYEQKQWLLDLMIRLLGKKKER